MWTYRLFKETPRTQKHFPKFAEVAVDALTGDVEYNKQVALVANRLDEIISAMDDKLQLLGNINYMKYSHNSARNPSRDFPGTNCSVEVYILGLRNLDHLAMLLFSGLRPPSSRGFDQYGCVLEGPSRSGLF